jgi:demethylmenaquinone methyltransferase/2-methoxy-6-polyprenyl-1,4-benzoquinol methylase
MPCAPTRNEEQAMAASYDDALREQITYYRARAGEYDEWFLRQGRYDRGAAANVQWHAEAAQVAAALDAFLAGRGRQDAALELAAGTGLWTQRLAPYFDHLTVVDASPEMLEINRARLDAAADRIIYEVADLFAWRPQRRYDLVFFSFWLSHVPPERFAAFWALVRSCLAPGGVAFMIDSRYAASSTARDHQLEGEAATQVARRLNDGSEFRIVKVFYIPERLRADLADLGWRADISATPTYFLAGSAAPIAPSG